MKQFSCFISRTYFLYALGIGFVLGVFLRGFVVFEETDLIISIAVITLFFSVLCSFYGAVKNKKHLYGAYIGIGLFFITGGALGVLRHHTYLMNLEHGVLASAIAAPEQYEIIGVVSDEPDVRTDKVKYTIDVSQFREYKGRYTKRLDYPEKLLVTLPLYPRYSYGNELKIRCTPEQAGEIEDFDYYHYLLRYSIIGVCYRVYSTEYLGDRSPSLVFMYILHLKQKIVTYINQFISEPYASLSGGILWGAKQGLSDDVTDSFKRVGITHIVAVSGYNITILANMVYLILPYCFVSRRYAWVFVLSLIILFVIFTGAQTSILRAGVMALVMLVIQYSRRHIQPSMLLLLTILGMYLWNPLYMYDIGFYLSFLATAGLIYLSAPIATRIEFVTERFGLREVLSSTLAATIMTLPVTLWSFHGISIVAPLVNMLVLPVIPWAMLIGFAMLLFGVVWAPLAYIPSLFLSCILGYVVYIAQIFSSFTFAYVSF